MKILSRFFDKQPTEDGTYNTAYIYKRLYQYFRHYWFRALLTVFITIPIGALDGAVALALKPYIDVMQVETSVKNVTFVPFIIIGFTLLKGLLTYFSIYLNGWLGGRIMSDLRRDLFKKLQTMDVSYFDVRSSGTIIQSYFQDPQALNTNILKNTQQMLTRMFSALFLMGVLIYTSWKLSIVAISVLVLILYPSTRIRKVIKKLTHESNTVTANILSFYTETVGGIRIVYGFNLPAIRLKQFELFQRSLFTSTMKYTQAQGWLTPSMHVIASFGIAMIIWQGSLMVIGKEITTGGFVSFIAAMLMLYNPIKNLGGSMLTAQMSLLAAGRILTTLDYQPLIVDKPDAKTLEGIQEGLTFDNVNFSYYPGDAPFTLMGISLALKKGETTALVGSSGGGKSTICSLIPRFYEATEGTIRIDGTDIRDFTLCSLRKNIAIVTQDNFLFDCSIRDNLLMCKPDATEDDMWLALEKAYLKDFVAGLGFGIDTWVGERGVLLSGGQRQRLAIARVFLKDSPIVLLDEATSALDSQAEAVVQKAMSSLMENRTVIVIAHRLSTIRKVDRIVVLEKGQIIEAGNHETLLAANGRYAELYRTQYRYQEEQPDNNEDLALIATA